MRKPTRLKRVFNAVIRGLTGLLCQIDTQALVRVPHTGPLILVSNHINFLEVPLIYSHLFPRPITGFAKAENWRNPIFRLIFNLWGAIPVKRGEVDRSAMRAAMAALRSGHIFAIAPEGTRSGDGRLRPGHPGVVILALMSGAPLLPVVHYGGEKFFSNLIRLRRTPFFIKVGEPFHLEPHGARVDRQLRVKMVAEIMFQIAALLPESYRGVCADFSAASDNYLVFSRPSANCLDNSRPPETD